MAEVPDAGALRLPAQLELIFKQVDDLDQQRARLFAQARELASAPDIAEAEIAEAYWRFEQLPAASFGRKIREVVAIARTYPWWSWTCPECGAEVFITSRSDKQNHERCGPRICPDCWNEEAARRDRAWDTANAARHRREQELRTMPYRQYLQTEEWQEQRKAARRRAGYACQVCNRKRVLHVHHRTYERRGAELARDLIVLCDECHALYHGKGLLPPPPADEMA